MLQIFPRISDQLLYLRTEAKIIFGVVSLGFEFGCSVCLGHSREGDRSFKAREFCAKEGARIWLSLQPNAETAGLLCLV